MSSFLVPASGGDSIPLRKSRIYLGRAAGSDRSAPPDRDTLCMLEMIDGWWMLEDLRSPTAVRINGVACKRQKLAPNDEIEIGRHRYLILYETPKYRFGRDKDGSFQRFSKRSTSHVVVARRTAGPHGHLTPLGGGPDITLNRARLTVGRRDSNDIVILKPTISGNHCELEFIEGFWFVRDLDSRNGIRIDSVRQPEGWVLPGQRLTIGDQRYQLDYTAEGPPPTGAVAVNADKSLMEQVGINDSDLERAIGRQAEVVEEQERARRWDLMGE
ncbi:MAG: FHA domain-containing protein [Planctomycetaceae bacterium]